MVAGVILFLAKCFECCGEGLWKKANGGYSSRRFRVDCKCSEYRSAFRITCLVWICCQIICLWIFVPRWIQIFVHYVLLISCVIVLYTHCVYWISWNDKDVRCIGSRHECLNLAVSKATCEWVMCANQHWTGSAILWSIEEYPLAFKDAALFVLACARETLLLSCVGSPLK